MMNNINPMTSFPQPPLAPPANKPKTEYQTPEKVFALICLLFGYLFIKYVLSFRGNVVTSLFFITFSIAALIYYKKSGVVFKAKDILFFLFINIFSLNFLLFDNTFLLFLTSVFIIFMIIYWNYTITKKPIELISDYFLIDMINATFVLPFTNYFEVPQAISALHKSKKDSKIKAILLGLIIAFPITLIVGNLLTSADSLFEQMMSYAFQNISSQIITFVIDVIFGIPVAFYLFGMLFANARKKHNNYIKEETKEGFAKRLRIAPATVLYTAVTPICILYVLFFISQAGYFLSAFQSYLPAGFSYAQYARRGFFELCAVAFINFILLILLNMLCKWKDEKKPVGLKIYTSILSVFTLMLIATAMSKMILYINNYGFTQLRIYTSWFMLLLATIFIIILLKAIFSKVKVIKSSVIAFVIFFTILSFSNVDGMIAKYNVKWYQSGKIEEMDISMLYQLSDSAVPYVIPLINDKNSQVAKETRDYLDAFVNHYEQHDWEDWNFSSYRAYQEYVNELR
jgi:hypothetical protein